jgi:light-regulated signal transduction histidine kinase (bacteriophytochrome)
VEVQGTEPSAEDFERDVPAIDEFSYTVAHELNTPLRLISILAETLQRRYASRLDGEGVQMLEEISANSKQMTQTIKALLELSVVGHTAIEPSEIDMESLMHEVTDELIETVGGRNFEIEIAPLPRLRADGSLLRHVAVNLISNAIKFTKDQNPSRIEVGSTLLDGKLVYYVKDNGIGFDSEKHHELFKPFKRLHSTEDFEGTGLGLSIAAQIIRHHGGTIWAEGKPGQGATFCFEISGGRIPSESKG